MKRFILLALLVSTQVLGDIWLSRGMKQFGEIATLDPSTALALVVYVFTNPWIWLGIVFLVGSLGFYLIAISWMDLSYVLPIHASSYVLNALLAGLILVEHITATRWLSTVLIAIGVLLVSFSAGQGTRQHHRKSGIDRHLPVGLFPLGLYLSKTWLVVIVQSLADASGDLFLALGMKQMGRVDLKPGRELWKRGHQIISNPFIWSGITCQAIAFVAFITVLTWADISFVRPATALTYIFSLLGARFILKETVNLERLLGIVFIGIGIVIHQ